MLNKAIGLMLNIFQFKTFSLPAASSKLLLECGLSMLRAGRAKKVQKYDIHDKIQPAELKDFQPYS